MTTNEIKEIVSKFNSDLGSIELNYGEEKVFIFWRTVTGKGVKKVKGRISWENKDEYKLDETFEMEA